MPRRGSRIFLGGIKHKSNSSRIFSVANRGEDILSYHQNWACRVCAVCVLSRRYCLLRRSRGLFPNPTMRDGRELPNQKMRASMSVSIPGSHAG